MWARIPGWDDYRVCCCGNVISFKRGKPKILKAFLRSKKRSYSSASVNLLTDGVTTMKTLSVASLVAAAFLEPKPGPEFILMHSDDNPMHNDYRNLVWGTNADNSMDMTNKHRQAIGERVAGARLTADRVRQMRLMNAEQGVGPQRLSELFGVSKSAAFCVIKRQTWRHI